jgi:hypothetical protein
MARSDHTINAPRLRLVGTDQAEEMASWHLTQVVAQENKSAARNHDLQPNDPRWVLAVQTAAQLEGDRLSPEARKRIERTAKLLGVRTFDASVIMAIVQDHARRRQPLSASAEMISLVQKPVRERDTTLTRWVLALACAGLLAFAMIKWVVGG